jgi:hypothetical protein
MEIKPIRQDENLRRDWRKINELVAQARDFQQRLYLLEHPNQRRVQTAAGKFIPPFQLYQSGTWLQWKVTTGYFKPAGATIIPTDVETQFTLTSGVAEYWFWLEVTNTTAVVTASATEPTWTINKVLIGWVDTDTDSASFIATPYQFLLTNVQIPCL